MAVKFIIDTASDISPEEAKSLGVISLPLKVVFGTEEYNDYVDITHTQFYEKLIESDRLPTTSQIPPQHFMDALAPLMAAGDDVIIITMSSKLSGTNQSARIAAAEYPGRVFVVDSLNVCISERILLQRGLELAKEIPDARALAERLQEEAGKVRIIALLDTLEYLKKGGRISSAVALAGSLLSIKPVLTFKDGEIVMIGKARGSKQGNNLLRKMIEEAGGVDFSKPFALAYSGLSDQVLQKYIADSADLWQDHVDSLPICTVGSVIGTHAGPGAIAVAFFPQGR